MKLQKLKTLYNSHAHCRPRSCGRQRACQQTHKRIVINEENSIRKKERQ